MVAQSDLENLMSIQVGYIYIPRCIRRYVVQITRSINYDVSCELACIEIESFHTLIIAGGVNRIPLNMKPVLTGLTLNEVLLISLQVN